MVCKRHAATRSFGLPNAPELSECRRSIDGWLVDANGLICVVGFAIRGYRSQGREAGLQAWDNGARGLNDIVLHEGIDCPTIEAEVSMTASVE